MNAARLFEASYRAEPAIGARLTLAVGEEKLGHLNAAATDLDQSLHLAITARSSHSRGAELAVRGSF